MPILLFCTKKTNFSSYPFAHELPCTGTGNVSHPFPAVLWVKATCSRICCFCGCRGLCWEAQVLHHAQAASSHPPPCPSSGCFRCGVQGCLGQGAWSSRFHFGSGLDFNLRFLWLSLPSLSSHRWQGGSCRQIGLPTPPVSLIALSLFRPVPL